VLSHQADVNTVIWYGFLLIWYGFLLIHSSAWIKWPALHYDVLTYGLDNVAWPESWLYIWLLQTSSNEKFCSIVHIGNLNYATWMLAPQAVPIEQEIAFTPSRETFHYPALRAVTVCIDYIQSSDKFCSWKKILYHFFLTQHFPSSVIHNTLFLEALTTIPLLNIWRNIFRNYILLSWWREIILVSTLLKVNRPGLLFVCLFVSHELRAWIHFLLFLFLGFFFFFALALALS
jgi:hypothetical protein